MIRRSFLVLVFSALCSCAPSTGVATGAGGNAGRSAATTLLEAVRAGDVSSATLAPLLAPSATLDTERALITGAEPIGARLAALTVGATSEVESVRVVARLSMRDGALLYAQSDEGGRVVSLALFPAGEGEVPDERVRAYVDAWNATDPSTRASLVARAWAIDGFYSDPSIEGQGRDGLDRVIVQFQRSFPRANLQIAQGVQRLAGGHVTFRWRFNNVDGFDVGVLDAQGQLREIRGFFSAR
jgi:hypothetical protein